MSAFQLFSRLWLVLAITASTNAFALEDIEPWQEAEARLPVPPQTADLVEFFVSHSSPNRFYVDLTSLQIGADSVVRYVLVVETPSGVRNVSFEGLRCQTGERKLYATGRADGTWADVYSPRWIGIANNSYNRHHMALARDYFCEQVVPVRDVQTMRDGLRRGMRP